VIYALIFFTEISFSRRALRYCFSKICLTCRYCSVDSASNHVSLSLSLSVFKLNVASYLQIICLAENFRTDVKDFVTLLTANACDIRKSILYLQFWIRSGGGFLEERPLSHCRKLIYYKRSFYYGTLSIFYNKLFVGFFFLFLFFLFFFFFLLGF
jgi:hypothetical protein